MVLFLSVVVRWLSSCGAARSRPRRL